MLLVVGMASAAGVSPHSPSAADGPPAGLSAADWQKIEAEIRAQIQAEMSLPAKTGSLKGSGSDAWFQIDVLAGDLSDQTNPVPSPGSSSGFGRSGTVALDGDWLAVGAPLWVRDNGFQAGAVFFYRRIGGTNWQQSQRILYGVGSHGRCGSAVAMRGRFVVIGCPDYSSGGLSSRGRILFYRRNDDGQFVEPQVVLGDAASSRCGATAAIGGTGQVMNTWAAITCSGRGDGPIQRGEVDVYQYRFTLNGPSQWSLNTTLSDPFPTPPQQGFWQFGRALAVQRDSDGSVRVAVGMPGYDNYSTPNRGRAFLFRRDNGTWSQEAMRARPGSDLSGAYFGQSVALDGGHWIVGAPGDAGGSGRAYAYVLSADGWSSSGTMIAPPADSQFNLGEDFGYALALSGTGLWVGMPTMDFIASGRTWVLRYRRTGSGLDGQPLAYTHAQTLNAGPNPGLADSRFGEAIAVDEAAGAVAIGSAIARHIDDGDQPAGRVFMYAADGIFGNGFQ